MSMGFHNRGLLLLLLRLLCGGSRSGSMRTQSHFLWWLRSLRFGQLYNDYSFHTYTYLRYGGFFKHEHRHPSSSYRLALQGLS